MPPTQNNSFIPKRNPSAKPRASKKPSSPLVSILVSIIFGATVISAGALLAYEWYLNNQLTATTIEIGRAADGFSEADLSRVLDFDKRLSEANALFAQHISINRALTELAQSTVSTIQFSSVSLDREDRSAILIEAEANTDDIGSVLAQRNIYLANSAFDSVSFSDLQLAFASADTDTVIEPVTVSVELAFPVHTILYESTRSNLNTNNQNSGQDITLDVFDEVEVISDSIDFEEDTMIDNLDI